MQEFALFVLAVLRKAAEFGFDHHEKYDPRVSADRTDGRGILLKVMERTKSCFTPELFCRLLQTRGVNVERALNTYLQFFGVNCAQVGGGGIFNLAGLHLYYDE